MAALRVKFARAQRATRHRRASSSLRRAMAGTRAGGGGGAQAFSSADRFAA